MFIKVTSSGGRRYAQLVESFRNEQGVPRQRTICTLGRVEPGGDVDKLIAALQRAQGVVGESCAVVAPDTLAGLQFLDARAAGDVWVLFQLWQSLGLDDLAHAWRRSRSALDVMALFRAMVFNRLCDPQSKLGVLRWLDTVALPVDFGLSEPPKHQHLLRAMDVLDEHHEALRNRMAVLMRPLIDQDLSLVFYDLTTIRAAGTSEVQGEVRAHGKAKSGLIERQFMLSLVQTADGLPIDHQVHPGNTAEAPTLLPMIRELVARYRLKRVVLVADRGLLSLSNLEELAQLQNTLDEQGLQVKLQYILAVPAARYSEFATDLSVMAKAQGWAQGQDEPKAKPWVSELDWQSRRLIVAHDPEVAQRRTTERRKLIDDLVKQGQQWGGQLDDQDAGQKRRGRPLSDSGAKARMFHAVKDANVANLIKVDLKHEQFSFTVDEERQRYLELLDGKLLLVTNTDAPAQEVVAHYKSLADIERGFRVLKSDIEIGPVYHRLPERIRAHAMVCFVALVLYRVMRMRLKAGKTDISPTRLLEQLRRIQHQTVQAQDGRKISGITQINTHQKDLLAALKLPTPNPQAIQNPHL